MNKLPTEKRAQIIKILVEGNSLRSASHISDVSINTVTKVLIDTGKACQQFHNDTVIKLHSERVQCDEIRSFVVCKNNVKEKDVGGEGDVWTWTALDADSKLIISWLIGDRDADTASLFMRDVRDRLENSVQLTIDGHKPYLQADSTASDYDVDCDKLIKIYGGNDGYSQIDRKYNPAECTGVMKTKVMGEPNKKFISNFYVESCNLTMTRDTRLTKSFSKKIEKHCYAIALHFVYYNFAKIHTSLCVTPAMQAGLTKKVMSIEDIVNLAHIEVPKKRGAYKKNVSQTT